MPAKFRDLQPASKSTTHSRPSVTDSDLGEQETQLRRTCVILSHQDWFLGAVLRLLQRLGELVPPETPEAFDSTLAEVREFLYSSSRAGYDARAHVAHLLANTVLRRRDAYLGDTFQRLQPHLRRELRSHELVHHHLFSESRCEAGARGIARR